jgi:hypothetical protein
MASTKNRRLDGSSLRWHCDHGVVISILLAARSAVVVAAAVGGRSLSSCHDIGVPRDVHLCWCSRTEEQQVVLTPFAARRGGELGQEESGHAYGMGSSRDTSPQVACCRAPEVPAGQPSLSPDEKAKVANLIKQYGDLARQLASE